jgi:hypothetical protein
MKGIECRKEKTMDTDFENGFNHPRKAIRGKTVRESQIKEKSMHQYIHLLWSYLCLPRGK